MLSESLINPFETCLLSGDERTWSESSGTSPFDPKPKLVTLCVKLVKIGAKVVRHGRYATFQMAEAAVPRDLFQ
ncbi:MAG: hypothetical protein V3S27_06540, partial [Kiloniellales bacterium]